MNTIARSKTNTFIKHDISVIESVYVLINKIKHYLKNRIAKRKQLETERIQEVKDLQKLSDRKLKEMGLTRDMLLRLDSRCPALYNTYSLLLIR